MARCPACITVLSLALVVGCGSGTPVDQGPTASDSAGDSVTSLPTPTDIVSHFLDEIRRGGEDSRAQSLLTQRAQNVLARIGHTVQPIGSPDARFEVTRSEPVPGQQDAALVHSLWREPRQDGTMTDYQVVWAVEKEAAGWRISGLAIEVSPNQSPQIVDFEDGEMMARLLATDSDNQTNARAPAQAAMNPSVAR